MQQGFNQKSSLSEAETALGSWGIDYERNPDGSLHVPGNLDISCEGLTALPDLSGVSVGGGFSCYFNQLTSLKGAPQSVGGIFSCGSNQLISLEGAPRTFKKLTSDFGEFFSWDMVPEELRFSPETRTRMEHDARARMIMEATVLQSPLRVLKPIALRR